MLPSKPLIKQDEGQDGEEHRWHSGGDVGDFSCRCGKQNDKPEESRRFIGVNFAIQSGEKVVIILNHFPCDFCIPGFVGCPEITTSQITCQANKADGG